MMPWAKLNTPGALKIRTKPRAMSAYNTPETQPSQRVWIRRTGASTMSTKGSTKTLVRPLPLAMRPDAVPSTMRSTKAPSPSGTAKRRSAERSKPALRTGTAAESAMPDLMRHAEIGVDDALIALHFVRHPVRDLASVVEDHDAV